MQERKGRPFFKIYFAIIKIKISLNKEKVFIVILINFFKPYFLSECVSLYGH